MKALKLILLVLLGSGCTYHRHDARTNAIWAAPKAQSHFGDGPLLNCSATGCEPAVGDQYEFMPDKRPISGKDFGEPAPIDYQKTMGGKVVVWTAK